MRVEKTPSRRFLNRFTLIPLLIVFSLMLFFLPGPNGLIRVGIKLIRIRQTQKQIFYLKSKADTLKEKIKLWQDPHYATDVARQLLESTPKPHTDFTPGVKHSIERSEESLSE